MLGQIQGDGVRLRVFEDVTLPGNGFGKELWHPVELRLYAVETLGDGDGIVEYCIRGIVPVCLLRGIKLVELEDIVDELFLGSTWRTRSVHTS